MRRCLAPCVEELCGAEEYREVAARVERFLEGDHAAVARELESRMLAASEDLAFEKAAIYRDAIEALRTFRQRQAVSFIEEDSEDYLALSRLGDVTCVVCLRRRGGSLRGSEHYFLEVESETPESEILSAFIEQYYESAPEVPRRILCSALPASSEVLQQWLTGMVSKKISVKKPHRGSRIRILDLAAKNAEFHAAEQYRKTHGAKHRIAESVLRLGARGPRPRPVADSDRRVRYLAPWRRGAGRLHGGLRKRRAQEIRLPQIQDQKGARR
jgi:excinuclease ABC subunit C